MTLTMRKLDGSGIMHYDIKGPDLRHRRLVSGPAVRFCPLESRTSINGWIINGRTKVALLDNLKMPWTCATLQAWYDLTVLSYFYSSGDNLCL